MKFELKEYYWNVPESEFIRDVIAVAEKLGKNTLTREEYSQHGKYHPCTLRKRFKSWLNLLERAGLKSRREPTNVADELLFKNLEEVWLKLGEQPTCNRMKTPLSIYGYTRYKRRFGTWMEALRRFIEYQNSLSTANAEIQEEAKIFQENKYEGNKKVNRTPRDASQSLRFRVFLRDGFRCTICGRSPVTHPGVVLHCDHINPWSNGGTTTMDNLQTLCSDCNYGKGNKTELTIPIKIGTSCDKMTI